MAEKRAHSLTICFLNAYYNILPKRLASLPKKVFWQSYGFSFQTETLTVQVIRLTNPQGSCYLFLLVPCLLNSRRVRSLSPTAACSPWAADCEWEKPLFSKCLKVPGILLHNPGRPSFLSPASLNTVSTYTISE